MVGPLEIAFGMHEKQLQKDILWETCAYKSKRIKVQIVR